MPKSMFVSGGERERERAQCYIKCAIGCFHSLRQSALNDAAGWSKAWICPIEWSTLLTCVPSWHGNDQFSGTLAHDVIALTLCRWASVVRHTHTRRRWSILLKGQRCALHKSVCNCHSRRLCLPCWWKGRQNEITPIGKRANERAVQKMIETWTCGIARTLGQSCGSVVLYSLTVVLLSLEDIKATREGECSKS